METSNSWLGGPHHHCIPEGDDPVSVTSTAEEKTAKAQMGDGQSIGWPEALGGVTLSESKRA